MASIKKIENGKYKVFYDLYENGKRVQRTKTIDSLKEAKVFKAECEVLKQQNELKAPPKLLFKDLAEEYIERVGKINWGPYTYYTSVGIIKNHLVDGLGHYKIEKITPLITEQFFSRIRTKKVDSLKYASTPIEERPCLSERTVWYIYIYCKAIFNSAIEWEYLQA